MPSDTIVDLLDLSLDDFPEVVPVPDFLALRDEYLTELARRDPRLAGLSPADSGYAMAEACAYREILLRTRFNDQVKDALLISAKGNAIDVHGAERDLSRETGESDDDYKARIYADILADSAGTVERYRYLTVLSDSRIIRAAADSDTPAIVRLGWVPSAHGDVGAEDIDAAVRATFANPSNRMLADLVLVYAGQPVDYSIGVKLLVKPGANRAALEAKASANIISWATSQGIPHRGIRSNSVVAVSGGEAAGIVGAEVGFFDEFGAAIPAPELTAHDWPAHPNETPGNTETTVIMAPYYNFTGLQLTSEVAPWLQR